jgi:hypothetical protein
VQNSIHQSLRSLDTKMAEIVGRQERIFSHISTVQNLGSAQNANYQQPTQV